MNQILRYTDWLAEQRGLRFDPTTHAGYDALWRWSVDDLRGFWGSIWDYFDLQSPTPVEAVLADERDARRALVPRRAGQLRAAGVPPRRRGARRRPSGDRVPERGDAARAANCSRARLARTAPPGRVAGGGSCAAWACSAATASARSCRTRRRPRWPSSPRRAWARSGRSARPTWGRSRCSTASVRSSRRVLIGCDGYVHGGVAHDRRRCCASCSTTLPSVRARGAAALPGCRGRRPARCAAPAPTGARLRRARRGRRRRSRPSGCRSTTRCGSSTRAAPPACRRRSCTATAA